MQIISHLHTVHLLASCVTIICHTLSDTTVSSTSMSYSIHYNLRPTNVETDHLVAINVLGMGGKHKVLTLSPRISSTGKTSEASLPLTRYLYNMLCDDVSPNNDPQGLKRLHGSKAIFTSRFRDSTEMYHRLWNFGGLSLDFSCQMITEF